MDWISDFNNVVIIISLIVALVSLIIAFVALRVSLKTFQYSTKDYLPNISYTIDDQEKITVVNRSRKIFAIDYIDFIKISFQGFEDYVEKTEVLIPFVVESKTFRWIKKEGRQKKIVFNASSHGPCAFGICPYDETMVDRIRQRINGEYSLGSEKGYAAPSFNSVIYLLEIVYQDPFQERKSLIFKKEHYHGSGYDSTRINEEQAIKILKNAHIPSFGRVNKLWDYLIDRYSIKFGE